MGTLVTIILFLFILGIIVAIHEFGHFYFAKRANIICHEYSIGMGPALWQKKKGETVYSIRAIPIGGYVMMDGEDGTQEVLKRGSKVALTLNDAGEVTEILEEGLGQVGGTIIDFDLYGKQMSPLWIELQEDEKVVKYHVRRDAFYVFSPKKRMQIAPEERSFGSKTLWQRFITIFAGPLFNFILAFVLYLIIGFFMFKPANTTKLGDTSKALRQEGIVAGDSITKLNGQEMTSWSQIGTTIEQMILEGDILVDIETKQGKVVTDFPLRVVLQGLGIANYSEKDIYHEAAIIGQVAGRAQSAGLKAGDQIKMLKIGSKTLEIDSWGTLIKEMLALSVSDSRKEVIVTYERDSKEAQVRYDMMSKYAIEKLGHQYVSATIGISADGSFDFSYSLMYPFKSISNEVKKIFDTLGLLFSSKENVGIKDLSGPVGIASLVGNVKTQGFLSIVAFTAFLSINIGLINLLPIPALDGGRIAFLGYEWVTKKKIHPKVEGYLNTGVFFLLLGLFVYITFNDILRLF